MNDPQQRLDRPGKHDETAALRQLDAFQRGALVRALANFIRVQEEQRAREAQLRRI